MDIITELKAIGYHFNLDNGQMRYTHPGPAPDPAVAGPLLAELRRQFAEHKPLMWRTEAEEEAWWAERERDTKRRQVLEEFTLDELAAELAERGAFSSESEEL